MISEEKRRKKREYMRKWTRLNMDKVSKWTRAWRARNVEKVREYHRNYHRTRRAESPEFRKAAVEAVTRYYQKNKAKVHARMKRQYDTNLGYRMLCSLRARLHAAVKLKTTGTLDLLGITLDQFLGHLEINFQEGMTWDNYGSVWHVDHKRPCASFDLTNPEEQKKCFNWKNLQPLFAQENLSKGAKYNPEDK